MSTATDRLDAVIRRADGVLTERLRREEAELERLDARDREAARDRARDEAARCREFQARYSDAYRSFGVEVPAPVEGESPGQFRFRLFTRLQRKLPSSHELAEIRADDLPAGPAIRNFERMLIEAAKAEGERPSYDSLPRDGTLVERRRVDPETNERRTEYFGRRSFIADMGLPGRRVIAFHPGARTLFGTR